jgi:hypothetical protein
MNHIPSPYYGFVAAPLRYEMKEAHGKSGLDQIVNPGFAKNSIARLAVAKASGIGCEVLS